MSLLLLFQSAAAASLTSVAFQASAVSNTDRVVMPSVATGDLGVFFDFAISSAGMPSDVIPTGWTGFVTDTLAGGVNYRVRISYKILTTAESGTDVIGMNGADDNDKVLLVFRGNVAIVNVTPSTWLTQTTSADPASQTVSASGQGVPLIVFGNAAILGGTAAFSTASPAFDATVAVADADMITGYKIYNSSPADHTIDTADLGANSLQSGYLILGGGGNKSLSAGADSYAVTGTNAVPQHGWKVAAGAGSYAQTGASAGLKHGWKISAGAGTITITGTDASPRRGRKLPAASGTYTQSGTAATPKHGWKLPAGAGSIILTGTGATLSLPSNLPTPSVYRSPLLVRSGTRPSTYWKGRRP